ncbi:MAG: amino acid adenylation domain-containing protein, partial [Proteobacteria bacterium]|nr:amino acid adenylation domain-containing protein [Pseudomonadota bacterium]
FSIGGNSIIGIKLISLVNVYFKSQVSVRDIFIHRTIEQFALLVINTKGQFEYENYLIKQSNQEDIEQPFPLTNVQQAYLYGRLDSFEVGNVSTHAYFELIFSSLDIAKLEQSLNILIQRHCALRTIFSEGQQQILKEVGYYRIKDHGTLDTASALQLREELSHKIYNPEKYPLFDFEVSYQQDKVILHVGKDALIMDGTSFSVFYEELTLLYNSKDPSKVNLPELKINFKDYMLQYVEIRNSELYHEAKKYWFEKLDNYDFNVKLPMKANPAQIDKPRFARVSKIISKETWNKLKGKAESYSISPTTIVLFAYGQVLSKWSGSHNFCINLTLFNRLPLHEQINDILGDFTVLELFNFTRKHEGNIVENIKEVHQQLWEDIEHNLFDGVDFQRLIRKEKGMAYDQSLSPVVLTSVLTSRRSARQRLIGLEGNAYAISQTSQVYLDNKALEISGEFVAEWDYVEQLFDQETIRAMHGAYCELLEYLAKADWTKELSPIQLPKRDAALIEGANCSVQVEVEETLVSLCDQAMEAHADRIAVIDSLGEYRYHELARDSHKVGKELYQGVSNTHQLYGVLAEKGYLQVVGTLGAMRTGGAYIPLSVDWPLGRMIEVLEEGLVKEVLISKTQYERLIAGSQYESAYEWKILEEILNDSKEEIKCSPKIEADQTGYVIFTSGSTGKPKGVVISHRAAVNTILGINQEFEIGVEDRVLALSDLSFDLSVYDLFGILAAGGTVVFPEQSQWKEPHHWYEMLKRHQVTIWDSVPQLMQVLMDYVQDIGGDVQELRAVLLSGDWIPLRLPELIKSYGSKVRVKSLGGATEGSIWSIWYEIGELNPDWHSIPYGVSLPNQKMYVLDEALSHCPIGVVGEIHIGGLGVAKGYWRDELKTGRSFIEHETLGRLYKTGDIGKWDKGGYIEFVGRKDNQVKLNGYRVELSEISSKLMQLRGIEEALTLVQENQLVSYLVSEKFSEKFDSEAQKTNSNDKLENKFKQKGLIDNLKNQFNLGKMGLNESKYRLRKSYRQFNSLRAQSNLTKKEILQLINCGQKQNNKNNHKEINLELLRSLLSSISAMKLNDKVLPKYRYPSGGSTYAIQAFVEVKKPIDNLASGFYYFHPVEHRLGVLENSLLSSEFSRGSVMNSLSIHFALFLPGIEPQYGPHAYRLGYLELGHMLALLEQELESLGLTYEFHLKDKQIPDYICMCSLDISVHEHNHELIDIKKHLNDKSNIDISYLIKKDLVFSDKKHTLDMTQQSVFERISETNQILQSSVGIICWESSGTAESLVLAGYQAQNLSENLYEKDIGSCGLGFKPYDEVIYSLAIGGIHESDKQTSETYSLKISLEEYLNKELKHTLPEYMLPTHYLKLKALPLTANGKIDFKQLPKVQIQQNQYVQPRNEVESKICKIWEKILEVEPIGITDDFFKLGGNSIHAIRAMHKMREALSNHIGVAEIFLHKNIKNICDNVMKKNIQQEYIVVYEGDKFPASFAQERLWFIEQYESGTKAYNIPLLLKLDEKTNLDNFKKSLQAIVARHSILRTLFVEDEKGHCYQVILSDPLFIKDVLCDSFLELEQQASMDVNTPFDLNNEYSIKVSFYYLNENKRLNTYAMINFHHIVFDGWSVSIFSKELNQFYEYFEYSKPLELPNLTIQYKDFSYWQRNHLRGNILEKQLSYWYKKLVGYETLQLTTDRIRPLKVTYTGSNLYFKVNSELSDRLRKLANHYDCTLYSILAAGFFILLNKYTNQNDILIGTPIANRHYPQVENLIGFFANTLVLREYVEPKETLKELTLKIHKDLIEMQQYQDLPFEKLIDLLSVEQDQSRHPIFQVAFRVQSFGSNEFKIKDKNYYEVVETRKYHTVSKFDLDLLINDAQKSFECTIEYATELFDPETIQAFSERYILILKQMSEQLEATVEKSIDQYQIITEHEYKKLIYDWNQNEVEYPRNKTFFELFQEQVEATPENIAVKFHDKSITYQELNALSNKLANYIRRKFFEITQSDLTPDNFICLLLDRSSEMIISILAVMKSGAAYVPVDPNYPKKRIDYILKDTEAKLVITQKEFSEELFTQLEASNLKSEIIIVDENNYNEEDAHNLKNCAQSTDLAYVIYTSGTTGNPKGVMIEHQSLVNLIHNQKRAFNIDNHEVILLFSSYFFDASLEQIGLAL